MMLVLGMVFTVLSLLLFYIWRQLVTELGARARWCLLSGFIHYWICFN